MGGKAVLLYFSLIRPGLSSGRPLHCRQFDWSNRGISMASRSIKWPLFSRRLPCWIRDFRVWAWEHVACLFIPGVLSVPYLNILCWRCSAGHFVSGWNVCPSWRNIAECLRTRSVCAGPRAPAYDGIGISRSRASFSPRNLLCSAGFS